MKPRPDIGSTRKKQAVVVVVVMISKKEDRCKSTMRLLDDFYFE
jgi:hypothetical protein